MVRTGAVWSLLVVACIFAAGSIVQLFLAGMSTFDSGLYWSDHIFLGRIVSVFALVLPVVAYFAKVNRTYILLSGVAAILYIIQTMLTYVDIGPLAALHAVNAIPLIALPAFVAHRARELLKNSPGGDATS